MAGRDRALAGGGQRGRTAHVAQARLEVRAGRDAAVHHGHRHLQAATELRVGVGRVAAQAVGDVEPAHVEAQLGQHDDEQRRVGAARHQRQHGAGLQPGPPQHGGDALDDRRPVGGHRTRRVTYVVASSM